MIQEVRLIAACRERGLTFATAESCTGGLVAARITSVPGASEVFLGGIISYANDVKRDVLGVPQEILEQAGAVSAECAEAMARGVRGRMKADVAVSVTGIAGPGGGTVVKPVGLVYFGVATGRLVFSEKALFSGDREAVRRQASERALVLLVEVTQSSGSPRPGPNPSETQSNA